MSGSKISITGSSLYLYRHIIHGNVDVVGSTSNFEVYLCFTDSQLLQLPTNHSIITRTNETRSLLGDSIRSSLKMRSRYNRVILASTTIELIPHKPTNRH